MLKETFPLRQVRFLQVRDIDISGLWSGSLWGPGDSGCHPIIWRGVPSQRASIFSPPITPTDAQGNFVRQTLSRIAWDGEAVIRALDPVTGQPVERREPLALHGDVRLQIQTRTSDQTDTNWTYYEVVSIVGVERRTEISKEAYEVLVQQWDEFNRGERSRAPRSTPDRTGTLAFVGWSEWSAPYVPVGDSYAAPVTSPSPRRFVQLRVNLRSDNPHKTAAIRSLRLELAPPLALELVGELALRTAAGQERPPTSLAAVAADYQPPIQIEPLEEQAFSYFIRAAGPDPADPVVRQGFDELLIVAPRALRLEGVRVGQVAVSAQPSLLDPAVMVTQTRETQFSQAFGRDEDGVFRNAAGQPLSVVSTAADSLYLRFPASINRPLAADHHGIVEVRFASQPLREGVEFASFIRDSRNPASVFQRVETERQDATELVDSRTARVSLRPLGRRFVQDLEVTPVITPNGDGVNDQLRVRFTLLKVLEERPLHVELFDLSGRLAGRAQPVFGQQTVQTGVLEYTWDGRHPSGELAPPGVYLCRVKVEADQRDDLYVRLVHVVY
jgi:hypothetical protein